MGGELPGNGSGTDQPAGEVADSEVVGQVVELPLPTREERQKRAVRKLADAVTNPPEVIDFDD